MSILPENSKVNQKIFKKCKIADDSMKLQCWASVEKVVTRKYSVQMVLTGGKLARNLKTLNPIGMIGLIHVLIFCVGSIH